MKKICIIPARGGSKRIPRKNLKKFSGIPIIQYSINAAKDSGLFDLILVSTDDDEIADFSRSCGAEVPFFRSIKNSDDYATTVDVLLEVLNELESSKQSFETLCCLYPTAPFVTGAILKDSYGKLKEYSSLVPIVKYSHPPQRGLVIKSNELRYKFPKNMNDRSQDLDPIYHDVGMFYWANIHKLKASKSLVMEHTVPYLLKDILCQDLDTLSDWEIAEFKFRYLRNQQIR